MYNDGDDDDARCGKINFFSHARYADGPKPSTRVVWTRPSFPLLMESLAQCLLLTVHRERIWSFGRRRKLLHIFLSTISGEPSSVYRGVESIEIKIIRETSDGGQPRVFVFVLCQFPGLRSLASTRRYCRLGPADCGVIMEARGVVVLCIHATYKSMRMLQNSKRKCIARWRAKQRDQWRKRWLITAIAVVLSTPGDIVGSPSGLASTQCRNTQLIIG